MSRRFITTIIVILSILSAALIILQASSLAVTELPEPLVEIADIFPGPSAKITSLNENGYVDAAKNYRVFFTFQILILAVSIFLSIPVIIVNNIGIWKKPELKKLILGFLFFIIGCSYLLFFQGQIDFEPIRGLHRYNIHQSVVPYIYDLSYAVMLYMCSVAPFQLFNYYYRGADGPRNLEA